MTERPEGYYWVKLPGHLEEEIMHWFGEEWWATGFERGFRDSELAEIGDRIAPPSET